MNDDAQFEVFKASFAQFMGQTGALVGHALSEKSKTAHLTPTIPWVGEAMSASMAPDFLESTALGPVHMGMTATSTHAR